MTLVQIGIIPPGGVFNEEIDHIFPFIGNPSEIREWLHQYLAEEKNPSLSKFSKLLLSIGFIEAKINDKWDDEVDIYWPISLPL